MQLNEVSDINTALHNFSFSYRIWKYYNCPNICMHKWKLIFQWKCHSRSPSTHTNYFCLLYSVIWRGRIKWRSNIFQNMLKYFGNTNLDFKYHTHSNLNGALFCPLVYLLVGKPEKKRPPDRCIYTWKEHWNELHITGPVLIFCKNDNQPLDSVKIGNYWPPKQLSVYQERLYGPM